jgi:integrase
MSRDRFPAKGNFVGPYWLSRRGHSRQWCRTWFDVAARQTRRASLGTADLEQAKEELIRWRAVNAPLRQEEPAAVLVRDLVLRHIEHAAPAKRSKNQIERSLLLLDDRFPGCTVAGLTPGMLEDWGLELVRAGRSGSYVRRILTDARSMLNRARKRGEVLAVPFVPVGLFEEGEGRKRVVSAEEVARVFLAAEDDWLRRFIMLGAGTGARTEALLELRPFQVDRKHGLLRFNQEGRRQTKKVRPTVRLAPRLLPWLGPGGDGRVIGRGVKAFGIAWRQARERSGLGEDVVPTTLRHTLATVMKERRVR